MRNRHSNGLVTVAMAITLLALEAITVLGVVRIASWWSGPVPAALARAGETTWSALTESAQRALVSRTMPAALAALRTTRSLVRAAHLVVPESGRGCPRSAALVAVAPVSTVAHSALRIHRTGTKHTVTRVVCTVTRVTAAKARAHTAS